MSQPGQTYLSRALFGLYWLFAVSSTFSIALAQFALGGAVILFLIEAVRIRHNPFAGSLSPVYLLMVLYVAWMILVSAINDNTSGSLASLSDSWLFLAVPAGVLVMQNQRDRRCILNAFIVALTLVALYGIVQHFTGITFLKSTGATALPYGGYRAQGAFTHSLTYGNYISVAAVIVLAAALHRLTDLSSLMAKLAAVAGFLAFVATILSFSRGPIIGFAVCLLILVAYLRTRKAIATVVLCGLVSILVLWQLPGMTDRFTEQTTIRDADTYQGGRLYIWNHSWQILKDNPVTGVGPGNFREHYQTTLPEDTHPRFIFPHAHNDPLHIAVIGGIPAAILWLALWLVILLLAWQGQRLPNHARPAAGAYNFALLLGSLMFLMTSLTEATFFDEEVRQLAMFIWALGLADWYNYSKRTKASGKTT